MASSHSDADVAAEHPPLAAAACMRASGSGWARGICATAGREDRRQRSKGRNLGKGIGVTLWCGKNLAALAIDIQLSTARGL
jgi:hypothetical protein